MLNKLMKYELKATARVVLPTFLGLLLFSIIARFSVGELLRAPSALPAGGLLGFLRMLPQLGILLYILAVMAVGVVVLVVIIQRFYKNLTGDEGYLMFTLPVRPWQLVWSKLLVAALWQLLSAAAIVASLAILLLQGEIAIRLPQLLGEFWQGLRPFLPANTPLICLLWVLAGLAGTLANTMLIYAAIAVGHTIKNHRVMGSVLSYFALTTVLQLVSAPLAPLMAGPLMKMDLDTPAGVARFTHEMLLYSPLLALALSAVMLAGFTYLTNQIFQKQLNLE